jgi:hypothetical protein
VGEGTDVGNWICVGEGAGGGVTVGGGTLVFVAGGFGDSGRSWGIVVADGNHLVGRVVEVGVRVAFTESETVFLRDVEEGCIVGLGVREIVWVGRGVNEEVTVGDFQESFFNPRL